MLAPPKKPCGSCPYRRDVPAGVWEAVEYEKLPAYDRETSSQPAGVFLCHQRDGCLCGGWLMAHDRAHLLALRFAAARLDPAVWDYDAGGVPCFGSGLEAAMHGLSGINEPSAAARRVIAGLERLQAARKGETSQ